MWNNFRVIFHMKAICGFPIKDHPGKGGTRLFVAEALAIDKAMSGSVNKLVRKWVFFDYAPMPFVLLSEMNDNIRIYLKAYNIFSTWHCDVVL